MKSLDYGEGSILALILPDGSEEYYSESAPSEPGFMTAACEQTGVFASEEKAGFTYYTKDGEKHLLTYSKTDSGYTLCALVPENNIIGEVNSLGIFTVILVAVGAAIAVIAGILLSSNIGRNIRRLTRKLDRVAEGDFTVEFGEGSTDEFGRLTRNVGGTEADKPRSRGHTSG